MSNTSCVLPYNPQCLDWREVKTLPSPLTTTPLPSPVTSSSSFIATIVRRSVVILNHVSSISPVIDMLHLFNALLTPWFFSDDEIELFKLHSELQEIYIRRHVGYTSFIIASVVVPRWGPLLTPLEYQHLVTPCLEMSWRIGR